MKWPKNCRAAVSLTYDDGLPSHPRHVAPELEAHGMRGTFYAPLKSDLMQNPLAWRRLAGRGHELGNHSVFHPCRSIGGKYSAWLPEEFNLVHYDADRWLDEMTIANNALKLVDGRSERTYGNTCFDNYLGPEENPVCLEPLIARRFLAARGEETNRPVNLEQRNDYNLGTVWADRRTFGDFAPELETILDTGGWVIYTFHGVGKGTHDHFIDEKEHRLLLEFLQARSNRIWTAPLIDVVKYLQKQASKSVE